MEKIYHSPKVLDLIRNNLIKSISSDKPCIDGYEIGNVLVNRTGFLASSFLRPPVMITIKFKGEVDIRWVRVHCIVGSQKTTGIEIVCQSKHFNATSSGILQEAQHGFVFYRSEHFDNVKKMFGDKYLYRCLKSSHHSSIITIKIFRTSGSSTPALGKVDIWGLPPKYTSTDIKPTKLFSSRASSDSLNILPRKSHFNIGLDQPSSVESHCHSSSTLNLSKLSPTSIPEEFIDPITCEIMTLPVIMPSGKVIDSTTLESYITAECDWGRGANDPFTGIQFSDSFKPIASTDLKVRIDKYLSVNSHIFKLDQVPRIVGSGPSLNEGRNASVSKLIKNSLTEESSLLGLSLPTQCDQKESRPIAKRRKMEENDSLLSFVDCAQSSNFLDSYEINSNNMAVNRSERSGKSKNIVKLVTSFQERMEQSFELALKSTLSKLPKLERNKPEQGEDTAIACNVCKTCSDLFSIPCNHFVCRKCLVNPTSTSKEAMHCLHCSYFYTSGDVSKVHLSESQSAYY